MVKKYSNSARSPPKLAHIRKFYVPPKPQKFKIRRQVHTKVYESKSKYSASFKKLLRSKLPIRSRHKVVMAPTTRVKAAGPTKVAPAPATRPTGPQTVPEKSDRSGSTSPKRSRDATGADGDASPTKRAKFGTKSTNDEAPTPTGESPKEEQKDSPKKESKKDWKAKLENQTTEFRRDWDRMPSASQQGFENITGSLCYRNGVVQALLHIPAFVNWVMDHLTPEKCVTEVKKTCVSCCLYQLVTEYWGGVDVSKTWKRFHSILKMNGWAADVGYGHADAGEQVIWIFDAISKEVPTEINAHLEKMFRMKSASVITCGSCAHKSTSNPGDAYILNIALQKGAEDLPQNIAEYLAAELLDDYKCETCRKTANNLKSIEIKCLPEVLCVQLNRIAWNSRTGRAGVNRDACGIPITLDLTKYHTTLDPPKYRKRKQKRKQERVSKRTVQQKVEYELLSVVKHRGSTDSGHYICAAVGPDGSWKTFDDQTVRKSSAVQATGGAGKFVPFILYYQRKRAAALRA